MATKYTLKRKYFGTYGTNELNLMREGKKAGLTGKNLRSYVTNNRATADTSNGMMASLTGVNNKGTTYGQEIQNNKADLAAARVTKTRADAATNEATRFNDRLTNKANPGTAKRTAMAARTKGYNAGMTAGRNSATLNGTVLKNTWNKMGKFGKAGTVAAGAAGLGLMAKGLFD